MFLIPVGNRGSPRPFASSESDFLPDRSWVVLLRRTCMRCGLRCDLVSAFRKRAVRFPCRLHAGGRDCVPFGCHNCWRVGWLADWPHARSRFGAVGRRQRTASTASVSVVWDCLGDVCRSDRRRSVCFRPHADAACHARLFHNGRDIGYSGRIFLWALPGARAGKARMAASLGRQTAQRH